MTERDNRFDETILESMPDAVIYCDAQGIIQYWNKGAERIFGFDASEATGQSLDMIVPEKLRHRHWEGYEKTMRTGETRYGGGDLLAVPAIRKDGTRISTEFTIVPFRNESGRMIGIAAIMRDITKRFEEMKALRAAAAARS